MADGIKETAKYSFPEESSLEGEPNGAVLKTLEYKCVSTGVSVKDATAMLSCINGQRHKKKLESLDLEENNGIVALLEKYIELEKPHREQKKSEQTDKGREHMKKIIEFKESLSKEEYKEHLKKRKADRQARIDAGEEEPKPKRKKWGTDPVRPWLAVFEEDRTPYRCGALNKTLRGYEEVKAHMQSEEFAEKAKEFEEGCALCGFKSDDKQKVLEHYTSMGHFKRLHALAYFGMDISNWYVGP